MPAIANFHTMREQARQGAQRTRIAVVWAHDAHTTAAVLRAINEGMAEAVFVGRRAETDPHLLHAQTPAAISHLEAPTPEAASAMAVSLVRQGKADVLMKGLLNTDVLLHAVLHKQDGILPPGRVLTHMAAIELPAANRLIFLTDAAVIPQPTLVQRAAQVAYAAQVCRAFGISEPRMALIHFTEKVSEKFPLTLDYVELCRRAEAGEWGRIVLDGPLDLLCALSPEGLADKRLTSPVEGRADVLLMPDMEAANALYKALPLFANARIAGMLCGTAAPVVLTSRADTIEAKYNSLAMAALYARHTR